MIPQSPQTPSVRSWSRSTAGKKIFPSKHRQRQNLTVDPPAKIGLSPNEDAIVCARFLVGPLNPAEDIFPHSNLLQPSKK